MTCSMVHRKHDHFSVDKEPADSNQLEKDSGFQSSCTS